MLQATGIDWIARKIMSTDYLKLRTVIERSDLKENAKNTLKIFQESNWYKLISQISCNIINNFILDLNAYYRYFLPDCEITLFSNGNCIVVDHYPKNDKRNVQSFYIVLYNMNDKYDCYSQYTFTNEQIQQIIKLLCLYGQKQ